MFRLTIVVRFSNSGPRNKDPPSHVDRINSFLFSSEQLSFEFSPQRFKYIELRNFVMRRLSIFFIHNKPCYWTWMWWCVPTYWENSSSSWSGRYCGRHKLIWFILFRFYSNFPSYPFPSIFMQLVSITWPPPNVFILLFVHILLH